MEDPVVEYENFDLRIEDRGTAFFVAAKLGPLSDEEPLNVNLHAQPLEKIEAGGMEAIEKYGSSLFNLLIKGKVRNLYHRARGGRGSDADKGLRIRIQIDARNPRLWPFVEIPWELLRDPEANAGQMVALDPRRAVVRTVDSNEASVDPEPGPLNRVLIVSANPSGTARLKLDKELEHVSETLERRQVQPRVLINATRAALREQIDDFRPQILHFMGHGSIDPGNGNGTLVLKLSRKRSDLLGGEALATFFSGGSMPRLVVLNACLTAAAKQSPVFNAFSSVAAALVAAGLPAVIAMQSTIRDIYAVNFAQCFYGSLWRGDSVETALGNTRISLSSAGRGHLDWAAPVLYVRSQPPLVMPERSLQPPPEQPRTSPREPNIFTSDMTFIASTVYNPKISKKGQ